MNVLIQNRIEGHGVEKLDNILFNPKNWRVHPRIQQEALLEVLQKVGWVQEVIINKRTGNLVDGHLRCQLAAREGETEIPVVYVDLSEEEEELVLATYDPIAAMSRKDTAKFNELMRRVVSAQEDIADHVKDISEMAGIASIEGFERPTFDTEGFINYTTGKENECDKNENWFYVEYYGDQDRFDELSGLLKDHLVGTSTHEIDSDLFYEIITGVLGRMAAHEKAD